MPKVKTMKSKSGKKWSKKAKAAYYATDGFTKPVKKSKKKTKKKSKPKMIKY